MLLANLAQPHALRMLREFRLATHAVDADHHRQEIAVAAGGALQAPWPDLVLLTGRSALRVAREVQAGAQGRVGAMAEHPAHNLLVHRVGQAPQEARVGLAQRDAEGVAVERAVEVAGAQQPVRLDA